MYTYSVLQYVVFAILNHRSSLMLARWDSLLFHLFSYHNRELELSNILGSG